jgi:predicted nucleic acid-binding protein
MKTLKLYLDTSIISHLEAPDVPDKEADTKRLWEKIKAGEFEAFISPVVIMEIDNCHEPKRSFLRGELQATPHTVLKRIDEVASLADQYVAAKILRPRDYNDCLHIAFTRVYNCDMLISWNFNHLVNIKTINGVKSVNALAGYEETRIYSPPVLIGGNKDEQL